MVILENLLEKLAVSKDNEATKKEISTILAGLPSDELYAIIVQNHDKIKQTVSDVFSDIKNTQYQDQLNLYVQLQRIGCKNYIMREDVGPTDKKAAAVTMESAALDVIEYYYCEKKEYDKMHLETLFQEADKRMHPTE